MFRPPIRWSVAVYPTGPPRVYCVQRSFWMSPETFQEGVDNSINGGTLKAILTWGSYYADAGIIPNVGHLLLYATKPQQ